MKAVVDGDAGATFGVFAGRHRLDLETKIVQPRRSGKAGVERCLEQALALREPALGVAERQMADEVLRADPNIAGEQPLEVERRQSDGRRRVFQGRLVEIIGGEMPDGAAHAAPIGIVFVERDHVCHGRKMGLVAPLIDPILARHETHGVIARECGLPS